MRAGLAAGDPGGRARHSALPRLRDRDRVEEEGARGLRPRPDESGPVVLDVGEAEPRRSSGRHLAGLVQREPAAQGRDGGELRGGCRPVVDDRALAGSRVAVCGAVHADEDRAWGGRQ